MKTNYLSKFLISLTFLMISTVVLAQKYPAAIGLRLGSPVSVTYKMFISPIDALEFFAGYRSRGNVLNTLSVNAAFQRHEEVPIDEIELYWYYGAGAGIYNDNYKNDFPYSSNYNATYLGLSGYIGLNYTFDNIPINVSVDWIPTFFIGDIYYDGFRGGYGALSVRYVLDKKIK